VEPMLQMIDKTPCLCVYLLLYGGAILALFAGASVRRGLLPSVQT
jgi:hypothetical protein